MAISRFNWSMFELHDAAYEGDTLRVFDLLQQGANVDEDDEGWTALRHAVEENHYHVCRLLLEAGADATQAADWSPREEHLLRLLVEFGCSPSKLLDPSWLSVRAARSLLELKADPNALDEHFGQTPLYRACMKSAEMVRLLLRFGADPLQHNLDDSHPLHFCAAWGYAARARPLLDAGVTATHVECGEYMALPSTCSSGHYNMAKLLLERGADPRVGRCIERAAGHGSAALVALLLEYGAEVSEDARELAREWLPDLVTKAKVYMKQWGATSTRHRWGKNEAGERTLDMRAGNHGKTWTDNHGRVLQLLSSS